MANLIVHTFRVLVGKADDRAEYSSAPLFLFLETLLAGGCRAPKFPAAAPLWRRTFGILSSPDHDGLPNTCDALPDEMFFTVLKDICSLGQSYLCVSAVSPPGTHRVCEQPDNPLPHVMERGFPRNQYPSPVKGGNKGAHNKT